MTTRPRPGTPAACALLVALMASYAAILLLATPQSAGAAAPPSPTIRTVVPTRASIDNWEQAALLAQQSTGGVVVEVDAEDSANTFEVDVVRNGVEIDLDVNVLTGRMTEIGRWAADD